MPLPSREPPTVVLTEAQARELFEAVWRVRYAQIEYFATRSSGWLKDSKALEKALDKLLAAAAGGQGRLL